MPLKIKSMGIDVPGKVTRTYDDAAEVTTLHFNEEQLRAIYSDVGSILQFIDSKNGR